MTVTLHHGNCLDVLPTLPDCSIDSIVTDPPYELGFMGKKWDASGIAYNITLWQECLRVLKPGGHLLAFGGTRTYHRMAVAIEDAGFEVRDSLHWIYGSGFPKSLDVSKAIDKDNGRKFEDRYALGRLIKACRIKSGLSQSQVNEWFGYNDGCQHWERQDPSGARVPTAADYAVLKQRLQLGDEFDQLVARAEAEREVIGSKKTGDPFAWYAQAERGDGIMDITAPATDAAKQWQGWGTALKPAHEPIVVARKPLVGTVAGNVLQYGTGALNIDGARVGRADNDVSHAGQRTATFGTQDTISGGDGSGGWEQNTAGRWPANIILTHNHDCDDTCTDGCPIRQLDGQQEGASRFFTVTGWDAPFRYVAKPGKRERNAGLDHLPSKFAPTMGNGIGGKEHDPETATPKANSHPTVKPLALMRWLVRLVTPPGGTVLEPFAGSGTTLVACHLENFNAIGIEMTDEYLPIIEGRVAWAEQEANKQQEELEL